MDLKKVSDKDLLSSVERLVSREREVLMDILHHLREIERRRLYSDLRQPSLFAYCVNVLKYSNAQADRRIKAMRLIKELPQIEKKISNGDLSLTNVAKAKEFFRLEEKNIALTPDQKLEVLQGLENKSTREAERILLAQSSSPAPEVKEGIRQVSAKTAEVKFAADEELLQKLEHLRGLLAHKNPNMKTSELINELCNLALNRLDPLRKKPQKPRKSLTKTLLPAAEAKTSNRKYISVKVKNEVWRKSEGKCQICRSTYALEKDHIRPVAMGGSSEPENLRMLCRSCNQRAAILKLGEKKMERYLT